ncbi:MAG: hypothetical protein Q9195_001324 [Heterodermia aff. obscurata]
MRADIKNAMRAKDINRLNVLRGFLAAADSASKLEPAAMRSESKVLALLSKQAKLSKAAAAEFKLAKRGDLEGKEEAQLAVLQEYISLIHTVPEDEVAQTVAKILSTLKANGNRLHYGNVMRDLSGRNGVYAEQALDMDLVSKIVKEQLQRIQTNKDVGWF